MLFYIANTDQKDQNDGIIKIKIELLIALDWPLCMRDTLHCVHIRWLTQLIQMSHQSMVFSGTCYFKNRFSVLFCPLFTVSPPSRFSLAPRIHPVPWTEFSKWIPPLFWLVISDYWFLLLFQSFPLFYSAPFPKLCHPAWALSIASIFICLCSSVWYTVRVKSWYFL